MKILTFISASLLALTLSACGGDHAHHDMAEGQAETTGTIISISPDGQSATIDHAEIEEIGMGAMTMGFEVASKVDLSGYSAGDEIAFRISTELGPRITIIAICNTARDGVDCLKSASEHMGH